MNKKYAFILLSFVLFCFSCRQNQTADFSFLEGSWKMQLNDSTYLQETWEKIDKQHYSALNYEVGTSGMKLSQESEIEETDSGCYYRTTIEALDGARQFEFELTSQSDNKFVFVNEEFNLPQKVWYKKIDDNKLEVGIESGDQKNMVTYIKEITAL
jgi:hypothetical protein